MKIFKNIFPFCLILLLPLLGLAQENSFRCANDNKIYRYEYQFTIINEDTTQPLKKPIFKTKDLSDVSILVYLVPKNPNEKNDIVFSSNDLVMDDDKGRFILKKEKINYGKIPITIQHKVDGYNCTSSTIILELINPFESDHNNNRTQTGNPKINEYYVKKERLKAWQNANNTGSIEAYIQFERQFCPSSIDNYCDEVDRKIKILRQERQKERVKNAGITYRLDTTGRKGMYLLEVSNVINTPVVRDSLSTNLKLINAERIDEKEYTYHLLFENDGNPHIFIICDTTKTEASQCVTIEEFTAPNPIIGFVPPDDGKGTSIDFTIKPEWYPYIGGGLMAALLLIVVVRQVKKRQRAKQKALREEIQQHQHAKEQDNGELIVNSPPVATTFDDDMPVSKAEEKVSGKILITKRLPSTEAVELDQQLKKGRYFKVDVSSIWQNSAVDTIYLSRAAILEINNFLRAENTEQIDEKEGDIPEIGGMLLGTVKQSSTAYKVSIDNFIPISSEKDNVYELKFDTSSIAQDLSKFIDEHPGYLLVGWFHTHPGHKLFLSKPDMRIQYGHFNKPYQFAMEIDSLTPDLDTGFFTWKQDGENMNNDLDLNKTWLSWVEIEKFTRRF